MRKLLVVAALALVAGVMALGGEPTIASACDVYVDDDNCASLTADGSITDPYCTIQDGIDGATAGQTVCVAKGTYTEDVQVNQSVTVQSASRPVVIGSFDITANDATLEGFEVRMRPIPNDADGIHTFGTTGVTIRNNKVRGLGPFTSCPPGCWTHCCLPSPPHAGISVILADDAAVEKNDIGDTTGVGIWFGSSTNSLIKDNKIKDTQYTGILLPDWMGSGPSHGNLIAGNHVRNCGNTAWVIDGCIRLGAGAYNNVVWDNHATGSVRSGIKAVGSTYDNTIVGNRIRQNVAFDAHDLSTGTRTASTANWWEGNKCHIDSPAGLCD